MIKLKEKLEQWYVLPAKSYYWRYDSGGNSMEFVTPFDPRQIDIDSKPMVISDIVECLKYGEIELEPDFSEKCLN